MTLRNLVQMTLLWAAALQELSGRSSIVVRAQDRSDILKDPIIYYTTTELACADGYPVQVHKIVTDDGYVLTVHRVPTGQIRPKIPHSLKHYHRIHLNHHPDFDVCVRESLNVTSTGLPVLFVHGVLMTSDGWLLQGPGYDLVYLMADRGFDVWMLNIRGNFYSRQHRTMRASDPKFWNFSFHENAVHDVPAVIDYILKLTGREKIGVVGYSMGTTIFFAMNSVRPEYNDKVLGFVGLAPVAFLKRDNMEPRRRTIFDVMLRVLENLEKRGDVHELFPRSNSLLTLGMNYCSKGSRLQGLCYDLVSLLIGHHSRLVLRNKFHLYLTHLPSGTSLKTFTHYKQIVRGNWFKHFDYGREKNVKIYGTATPPDYPLRNITVPVALYYSKGDIYTGMKDVEELRNYLPNVVDVDLIQKFNHGDYLWSYKAKDLVYSRVLSVFEKLQNEYNTRFRRRPYAT